MRVLLLSQSYEPISVISWQKAISMSILNKIEIIKEYEGKYIHSVYLSIKVPAVARLLNSFKRSHRRVKFNKTNILARDGWKCCYCGNSFPARELTYDHVVPRSRGGKTNFENVVACCIECNKKKGSHLPHEIGFKLKKKPARPEWSLILSTVLLQRKIPDAWKEFVRGRNV